MVCPNCNNMIPDGSIACNYCGYAINAYAVQRNTQQLISYPQVQPQPQYYQNQRAGLDQNTIITIISIIGIASVVLKFFATIAPLLKIYTSYDSYSISISDDDIAILFWIDCVVLLLYSLPGVRYIRADGIGKIFVGSWGLIGTVYLIHYSKTWFSEQSFDGIIGTVNMSFQAGTYLLFIAHILTFISGILLIIYGYKNKREVDLSRKADGTAKRMLIIEAVVCTIVILTIASLIYAYVKPQL